MNLKQVFIAFAFMASALPAAALTVIYSSGGLETATAHWQPVPNTAYYNVYVSGEGLNNQKIDNPLIRNYGDYFRADVPGLKAGSYTLNIVAVDSDNQTIDSAVTGELIVEAHDRSGFAFSSNSPHKTASGAYNNDGTLKANAHIIYLTNNNPTTVTMNVKTNSNGAMTACTGIGAILKARQKGYDQTPLAIRLIGKITQQAMAASTDALGSDDDLQCKGNSGYTELNTTIEGIGDDATAYGWGILVRNCKNIEIRNIGFMNFPEDGVSLNTANANIWVHHCDFFYGKDGGGDKNKGDGSLDCKESGWVTLSYNHFWDSGKCNLLGNGTENPEYLTYHHNWYDHSDSRHPRVRFHTVHVYNNYYDGNSKYGIGAAKGCPDIFAENNYFQNCKYPMLISKQGSDIAGGSGGTFSSEDGGMIKAFGNYIYGASRFVPYSQDNIEFDAYVANRRDEQVPATVTTKQGGCTYSNFDTDPSILGTAVYPCNIDLAENVPAKVKQYAGRMNGSDIRYTFTDADNNNANIMDALAALVKNYESSLVAVQGEENSTGGGGGGGDDGGGEEEPGDATGGGGLCDIVTAGASSGFTINGNTSTSKGSVTVNGTTYTCCLKMESATSITFKTTVPSTLTLVFESKETGKKVKIDGVDYTTNSSAKVVAELAEGNHEIKKGDSINLFYLALSSQATGIQEIQFDSEMQIYLLSGRKIYQGKSDNIETIITKHGKQGVYVIKSKGESKKIVLH